MGKAILPVLDPKDACACFRPLRSSLNLPCHNICSVAGGSYLPSRRVWIFPVASHAEVLSTLQSVQGVRVHVEPLAKCALAVLQVMSGWV